MAICHIRFRKAFAAQGYDLNDLRYKSRVYPWGPIIALVLCAIIIVGQAYWYFTPEGIDWMGLIGTYTGGVIFVGFYLGFKFKHKTEVVKLEEIDLHPTPIMEEHRLAKFAEAAEKKELAD